MASKSFSTATLFVLTTTLLFFTFTMASCPPKYKKPKKHTPKYRHLPPTLPKYHPPTLPKYHPTPSPIYHPPTLPKYHPTPSPIYHPPTLPKYPCPSPINPTPSPRYPIGNPNYGKCPMDALKLNVCANVLNGLINVVIGTQSSQPCCSLIKGLVDLDAAICLCTAIKANVLGINLNVPLSLSLLVNQCGRSVPYGFQCP